MIDDRIVNTAAAKNTYPFGDILTVSNTSFFRIGSILGRADSNHLDED